MDTVQDGGDGMDSPMRRSDPPGYVAPYRKRHHVVTGLLSNEEFNDLATIAARSNMRPSAFVSKMLKLYIEQYKKEHDAVHEQRMA